MSDDRLTEFNVVFSPSGKGLDKFNGWEDHIHSFESDEIRNFSEIKPIVKTKYGVYGGEFRKIKHDGCWIVRYKLVE